ncbi:hypothetical protein VTN96DRAFT_9117 [Rasamsonia emersonii]
MDGGSKVTIQCLLRGDQLDDALCVEVTKTTIFSSKTSVTDTLNKLSGSKTFSPNNITLYCANVLDDKGKDKALVELYRRIDAGTLPVVSSPRDICGLLDNASTEEYFIHIIVGRRRAEKRKAPSDELPAETLTVTKFSKSIGELVANAANCIYTIFGKSAPDELEIKPYGPIRPGDFVLQVPPINRNYFPDILQKALRIQMPAIIHGPYQSGKTSLLYAMKQYLKAKRYTVLWVNLDYAIGKLSEFTEERFYEKVSFRMFKRRMDEGQFVSHLERKYGGKKTTFCLIDEMQWMIRNNAAERTVRKFCRCLDENGIPYKGVGTSQLRKLAWKHQDFNPLETEADNLGSPFNRVRFELMPRLDYGL